MKEQIFNNKIYRLVTVRGRSKWIAKDGSAMNPIRKNQKVTIHFNQDDYPCYGGGVPIHLYVAIAWVDGYFKGAEVNHKDFNRHNYNADNLEWVTHVDNVKYSIDNNYDNICKSKQGVHNGRAIFSEDEVKRIRKLAETHTTMEIVKLFYPNMDYEERRKIWSRFDCLIKNKTWKHI